MGESAAASAGARRRAPGEREFASSAAASVRSSAGGRSSEPSAGSERDAASAGERDDESERTASGSLDARRRSFGSFHWSM